MFGPALRHADHKLNSRQADHMLAAADTGPTATKRAGKTAKKRRGGERRRRQEVWHKEEKGRGCDQGFGRPGSGKGEQEEEDGEGEEETAGVSGRAGERFSGDWFRTLL